MTNLPPIENNIPMPTGSGGRWGFDRLEVGQSMVAPLEGKEEGNVERERARRAAHAYASAHGWKMKTYSVPGGLRIWRKS